MYHKGGFKKDKFGFPMVNVACRLKTDEPYVLASQAEQVYYVKDIKNSNWQVVVKTKPRDLYDLPIEKVGEESCQENEELGSIIHESNLEEDDDNMVSLDMPELANTNVEGNPLNLDIFGDEEEDDEFIFIDTDDKINSMTEDEGNDDSND
ncbi:hypothetical protein REPUB_Repub08aG0053100 [Reevesia pubescens]